MAFRDSINDLMFRFYERFKQNNNRLPVSVDADINMGDVQIGTVKQGGVDEGAEPWKVKAEELEQKIDALKQSIESGVQLKGRIGTDVPNPVLSEIPTTTLTDTYPNNVADLTHSPSNVPMVVDWAMIASNSPSLIILMMPRDAAGAPNRRKTVGQGFVNLNGTPNFYAIRDGYYPGWEIVEWNQEANLYKARFTGPAYWPFGGRIRLQKGGPSPTIQVAATWSYRLMEVVNHE